MQDDEVEIARWLYGILSEDKHTQLIRRTFCRNVETLLKMDESTTRWDIGRKTTITGRLTAQAVETVLLQALFFRDLLIDGICGNVCRN
jgi:hypothetical protein